MITIPPDILLPQDVRDTEVIDDSVPGLLARDRKELDVKIPHTQTVEGKRLVQDEKGKV